MWSSQNNQRLNWNSNKRESHLSFSRTSQGNESGLEMSKSLTTRPKSLPHLNPSSVSRSTMGCFGMRRQVVGWKQTVWVSEYLCCHWEFTAALHSVLLTRLNISTSTVRLLLWVLFHINSSASPLSLRVKPPQQHRSQTQTIPCHFQSSTPVKTARKRSRASSKTSVTSGGILQDYQETSGVTHVM